MEQGLKADRASGAAAAGMGGISGAGVSSPTSGAPGGMAAVSTPPLATVAPPDTGAKSIADEQEERRKRRERGRPSGRVLPPRAAELDESALSQDADGTWRVTQEATGDSWRWDPDAGSWKPATAGAPDAGGSDWGPPEELAKTLYSKG